MTKHEFKVFGVRGAVALGAALAMGACGQGFSNDCAATRTCPEPGEQGNAGSPSEISDDGSGGTRSEAGDANETTAAGAPTEGGSSQGGRAQGGTTQGGSGAQPPSGGEGGATPVNVPPSVIAVSPTDKSITADPATTIDITFSEPLDDTTVTSDTIQVFDGGARVTGTLKQTNARVTFTPDAPLLMLESYRVVVSTGVKDVEGAALLQGFDSTFTTRDGLWKTTDAVTGKLEQLADSAITASGSVLTAWTVASGGCPATARWLLRGKPLGAAKAFDANDTDCSGIAAGANAAGTGATAWLVPDAAAGVLTQQFRKNAWAPASISLSTDTTYGKFRIGVSPTGVVTLIAQNASGTSAWHTDTNGKWTAQPDLLSSDKQLSRASIAFDASGDGLAVWNAQTAKGLPEILSSRFTSASGKWSKASVVPDSSTSNVSVTFYEPALAMTPEGDAMVAWTASDSNDIGSWVTTSLFSHTGGWAANSFGIAPNLAYGDGQPPGITYDGSNFIVAWVTKPFDAAAGICGSSLCTYVKSYDVDAKKWASTTTQQTSASDVAANKMPRLASDGRGHSMLVWAEQNGASAAVLVYQRSSDGENWTAIDGIADADVSDKAFAAHPLTLSMNAAGMAALTWGTFDASNNITSIRLASFY